MQHTDTKADSNTPAAGAKRVYIVTYGCQMNLRDSEVICGLLKGAGYSLVDTAETADAVIFNTCSVRQHAEDKVWSEVGRRSKVEGRRKPILGIVGCMAQNYKEGIFRRAPQVDFVVGPADVGKIPDILGRVLNAAEDGRGKMEERKKKRVLYDVRIWETDGLVRPEEIYHTGYRQDKEHAYVVISEGCSNFCSYCVVPYTRGELRHRPAEEIVREVREAVSQGITKVTLLGQNVNAYQWTKDDGRRSKVGFTNVLELVNGIEGLTEIGFITSHPKDTREDLFRAMARLKRLKKFLHLPVQSGSDRVLKAMNRGYVSKYYYELVEKYRTIVPGGRLTTDIIVGYPGETGIDFRKTYELVERVRFDAAFIFKYSPRPGTAAGNLPDDVPKEEKERRHALILDLQRKISKSTR